MRELGAEAESGPRRLEGRDSPASATMENGRTAKFAPYWWWAEGEQRGSWTTAVEEAGVGWWLIICEPPGSQGCPPGSEPTPGWTQGLSLSLGWIGTREPTLGWTWEHETMEGWTGPAGTKERGEGQVGLQICFPVYKVPIEVQHSTISSPSAAVQGAELHFLLSPFTACSLGAGIAAGSRTWADGMGSVSGAIPHSVALRWLVDRGGKWLSVIGGIGLELCTSKRWWAGLWVRSGTGEIPSELTVNGDPYLTSDMDTKAAKSSRGQYVTVCCCRKNAGGTKKC